MMPNAAGAHLTLPPETLLLERYRVDAQIAAGGMSRIYRAHDLRLERPVCVKVFFGLDRLASSYRIGYEHFVQEVFALSQLQHPNTIRIYDYGHLDDERFIPFYVSELLAGGTLRTLVQREGTLRVAGALELLGPLAGALGEAHARGIIHRDLKPLNILFDRIGPACVVKLADFGIAKAGTTEDQPGIPNRAEETQVVPGQGPYLFSPGWAAPEQLYGRPVSPATDVFGLGLLTVYMLTGRKIFSDNLEKASTARSEGDAYVEKALGALGLAPEVTTVLTEACRTLPGRRYQSAAEFHAALSRAASHVASDDATTLPAAGGGEERTIIVSNLLGHQLVAAGRRVTLVEAKEQADFQIGTGKEKVRLRATLRAQPHNRAHLHLKGLNCFVARPNGRPSSAIDLQGDAEVVLLSPRREQIGRIVCSFGELQGRVRRFIAGEATLALPEIDAPVAVLLDFGPDRELVLVHHPAALQRGVR